MRASLGVVAVAVCVAFLAWSATSSSASSLNVTGTWKSVYHCKTGSCAGQDFPAGPFKLVQAPGSSIVTGGGSAGTLSGHTLRLHSTATSGYTYTSVLTVSADGTSWTGTLRDSNGTTGTDTGTRLDKPLRISGHVNVTCEDATCHARKGAPGITVTASGGGTEGRAVTDKDGAYTIKGLDGDTTYEVAPQLPDNRSSDPASRSVALADANVGGVDFGVCGVEGASTRATSPAQRCQRLYTIRVSSWIPQSSIADPFLGSNAFDGSDFPAKPHALGLSFRKYPPCLDAGQLQSLKDLPDAAYRARFLGDRHVGFAGPGLGTVEIPLAFTGQRTATGRILDVRPIKTTDGSLTRVYDYSGSGATRIPVGGASPPSCTVTRDVTPVTSVKIIDKNHFQIDVSWPLPFAKYEDATTIDAFRPLPKTKLKASFLAIIEQELNKIPGYQSLPKPLQTTVKTYAAKLVGKVGLGGLKLAVETVIKTLGKVDNLTNYTPPALKYGAKALELLNKLEYGSPDLQIRGSISTTAQDTVSVHLEERSDSYPSFGLQVEREFNRPVLLPWQGPQPEYVANDGSVGSYAEALLQGGPGKAQIVDGLSGFTRADAFSSNISQVNPGLTPRELTYQFVGERSR